MPAYLNDIWGKRHLSTIHGRVLLAWGFAGISSPVALSYCRDITGTYTPMIYVFIIGMLINFIILWKLRTKVISNDASL
jgi:OFA family oxalate/formate antiporter-like MFS transporter